MARPKEDASWSTLNETLAACSDEATLSQMLQLEALNGTMYRVKRIYGRLSTVRRARELKELRQMVKRKGHR